MNISTNSNERIVLGNLSNSNTNFFTGSNTKAQSNTFQVPSKKKIHVDTPFPTKSKPKINLSGIDKNDPENMQYNARIFDQNNEDTNPIGKNPSWKASINRPKAMEVKKPKLMLLNEFPVAEDTLNKKRQLEIEDEGIEEKFGESYKIPPMNDFMFVEEFKPVFVEEMKPIFFDEIKPIFIEEKKSNNRVIDNVSFADTFQTFSNDNEKNSQEEKETGEMVNFYAEFPIDLSFGDGEFFIVENNNKNEKDGIDQEIDNFLEADLVNFKPDFIEDIFE